MYINPRKILVILFIVVVVSLPFTPAIREKVSTPIAQGYSASRLGAGSR